MPTSLLVGAHFRPPAKSLLASLATGQELILWAEPDNPYDPDAISVWIASNDLVLTTELELALASQGFDFANVLAQPEWQLGYIAAATNKALRARPDLVPNTAFRSGPAKLLWGPSGEPQVHQASPTESQP